MEKTPLQKFMEDLRDKINYVCVVYRNPRTDEIIIETEAGNNVTFSRNTWREYFESRIPAETQNGIKGLAALANAYFTTVE